MTGLLDEGMEQGWLPEEDMKVKRERELRSVGEGEYNRDRPLS